MTTMDRKPRLGQQLVYLHCRSLFVGDFTRMRSLSSIQKFLEKRRHAIPVLFDGYPSEKVCSIAQKLLIDGIFTSETLARQRFPLLFDPARLMRSDKASSNEAPSERALSEKGSSEERSSKKALSVTKGVQINTGSYWPVVAGAQNRLESLGSDAKSAREAVTLDPVSQHIAHSSEVRAQVPPPAPVYLPFAIQHRILINLQAALEGTCFDLILKILPEVIKAQELEVPEQLELKEWVSLLREFADHLPCTVPAMGWEGFLGVAEKLQSTIARRTRTSVNGMINFLDNGIIMTQSFKDVGRTVWCQHIHEKLQSSLANIERFENDLREKLSVQLQDIARKRAELDAMEIKAIAHMMEVEKRHRVLEHDIMKQGLLDLNIPGEKVLSISNGPEPVKIKEGESNLKGNLDGYRIPGVSAYDTTPKKAALYHSESQIIKQDPETVDQPNLSCKPSRDSKSHSYSAPLESSNLFSSQSPRWSTEISYAQTFSKQLAAEMTAGSPTETPSALSQKADLNVKVKSEPEDEETFAKPYAIPPPSFLCGPHASHKENSSVWD